ncbi:hypothetical protein Taro_019772 [Colocasia esculenta]|uniref:chitinase n=1 Tax=Colocasia esculenta TaxID=4460 RepID=A0A843V0B4_COLES|nr:hypothetical protein [Colocasia esculenta]
MTPQSPKLSCHDVITGRWTPSPADQAAGRVPGFGLLTNIINGGWSAGMGPTAECRTASVSTGDTAACSV